MSENVSSAFTFGFTLTSVSMASVWSLHPQQVRLHVDFVTQQFGDRTGQVMLEYFFSSRLEVFFFFLLHSFTNMEHDVRDLNRLITSSKAIEYTAGKYFYQSFYTWIISCSESCYNKPIFPHCLSPWLLVWRVKAILSIDCSRKRSMFGGVFWSQHFFSLFYQQSRSLQMF